MFSELKNTIHKTKLPSDQWKGGERCEEIGGIRLQLADTQGWQQSNGTGGKEYNWTIG